MTVYELIATLGRPVAYGYHRNEQDTPYFCLLGAGQDHFDADNTYYKVKDRWDIELYFTTKDPELEAAVENLLLSNGYNYEKSEDTYIEDEDVFVIYYSI